MPLKGKCPTPDCEWRYNVHKELKISAASKIPGARKAILCPNCKNPIESKVALCKNCGHFVVGTITVGKRPVVFSVIIILLLLSLVYKVWLA